MKLKLALVLITIALTAVGYDALRQQAPMEARAGSSLPPMPDDLPIVNPQARYQVVHLWATWCPPCMVEMPNLLAALPGLPDDVALLMVSLDDPPPARFYQANAISLTTPQVRWVDDPSRTLTMQVVETVKLPTTLIYTVSPSGFVQQIDGPLLWPPLLEILRHR